MTVAGIVYPIFIARNIAVAWSVNETHLPHEFPKIFRPLNRRMGKDEREGGGSKIDEAHSSRRPTFRIEESFLCEQAVGRMGGPRNGGPREGWQRRREEKKRAIRSERAASNQTRTNIIQNYPAVGPLPFSHISSVEKGVLSGRGGGDGAYIRARPCVISWLSSVERATPREYVNSTVEKLWRKYSLASSDLDFSATSPVIYGAGHATKREFPGNRHSFITIHSVPISKGCSSRTTERVVPFAWKGFFRTFHWSSNW